MSAAPAITPPLALVTGAGRGIGRSIALALARRGHGLVLVSRTRSELESVAAECEALGAPRAEPWPLDLAEAAGIERLCDDLCARDAPLDVLVNDAGIATLGHALDGSPDDWDRMMAVNALAPMRLIRRLAPGMVARERGTIVNVGSIAAIEPMRVHGAYAASKHALRGFSLSTYERLREHGVKTVLVNPAFVATSLVRGIPGVRLERMLTVDDVTAAVMLALDTSAACCPQEITLRLTKRADA